MTLLSTFKNQIMETSRTKKENLFYEHYGRGMSVLDVGVSAETGRDVQAVNHFLRRFKYDARCYTGLGVENLSGMSKLYPGKKFVKYSGGRFPFKDKQFDWVYSNAVVEHVGNEAAQLFFINEMLRVAHNVFFTTPNKFFPIETHTTLPLLHWNNALFYAWCKRHRKWLSKDNLFLFSRNRLKKTLIQSNASMFNIQKNYLLGFPMTFTVICAT